MKWLLALLNRLTCPHDQYIIDPDQPSWARCVTCRKSKWLG